MNEQYSPIDWNNTDNIEFVPGSKWEGWKITHWFPGDSPEYPNILVFKGQDGKYRAETFTDRGVFYIGEQPAVRNKPKEVIVPDFWISFDPRTGEFLLLQNEPAANAAKEKGLIVIHHPSCQMWQ